MKSFYLLTIAVLFCSCSPKIRTVLDDSKPSLAADYDVYLIPKSQLFTNNFKIIGKTSAGDTGFTTNCGYDSMLDLLKKEARKSGANALKITEHILPNIYGSSCHRLKADLFFIEDIEAVKKNLEPTSKFVYDPIKIESITVKDSASVYKKVTENPAYVPSKHISKRDKIILTANIGTSFRLGETPNNIGAIEKSHIESLKRGLSYDISAYYMTSESSGFGLKYNVFQSQNTINNLTFTLADNSVTYGSISDDITIGFIGASVLHTENTAAKVGEGVFELAIGYIYYKDYARYANNKFEIRGGNLGMTGGFGYHFRVTPKFLIGPQVNFIAGVLKEVDIKYENGTTQTKKLDKDEYENLWRIDLVIGAKFRF